jgi:hypothetical protein
MKSPNSEITERCIRAFLNAAIAVLAVVVAVLIIGLCDGCTVTPESVRSNRASLDGNTENSGVIGTNAQGDAILTAHAMDRYNRLMAYYGHYWSVKTNEGVTPTATNTFLIDRQHFFYFSTANRWSKSDTNFVRLPQ